VIVKATGPRNIQMGMLMTNDSSVQAEPANQQKGAGRRVLDSILGRHFGGGYDFFISYAWKDGRRYAVSLRESLGSRGFRCFLDSEDYEKGTSWKSEGKRALKKAERLLLVVTPAAMQSEPVQREVRVFRAINRPVWPIDIAGIWESDVATPIRQEISSEILRFTEVAGAGEDRTEALQRILATGPSNEVLQDIAKSFKIRRQNEKRVFWLGIAASVFFVLAVGAGILAGIANSQRRRADENASTATINEQRAWRSLGTSELIQASQAAVADGDGIKAAHWFLKSERSYHLAHSPKHARNSGTGNDLVRSKIKCSIPLGESIKQIWSLRQNPGLLSIIASERDHCRIAAWNSQSGELNSAFVVSNAYLARASDDGSRFVIAQPEAISFRSGLDGSEYAAPIMLPPEKYALQLWVMNDLQRGVAILDDGSTVSWPSNERRTVVSMQNCRPLPHQHVPILALRPSSFHGDTTTHETQLWDVDSAVLLQTFPGMIDGVFDTSSRNRFLGWDAQGTVWLWEHNVEGVKSISVGVPASGASFSADGDVILIRGSLPDGNSKVVFWKPGDSTEESLRFADVSFTITLSVLNAAGDCAFLSGNQTSSNTHQNLVIRNAAAGTPTTEVNIAGSSASEGAVFFNADHHLATWNAGAAAIEVWDVSTQDNSSILLPVAVLSHQSISKTYRRPFVNAFPNGDSESLISWASDGVVRVWNPVSQDGELLPYAETPVDFLRSNDMPNVNIQFSKESIWVAAWSDRLGVWLWQPRQPEPAAVRLKDTSGLRHLVFSTDEDEVIIWFMSGRAVGLDPLTGNIRAIREAGNIEESVIGCDEHWITLRTSLDELTVLHAQSGLEHARISLSSREANVPESPLASVSPDGKLAAVWDKAKTVDWNAANSGFLLCDLRTGRIREVPTTKPVSGFTFSADGKHSLTIAGDVFHGTVAANILETALPHDRAFGAAANDLPPLGAVFAPQADAMLTWHWDNFAYLWDAKSGRRLQAFRQDEVLIDGTAISAAINNDGSLLLTSSPEYNDTPTKLWDVDTGMVLREFFAKGGAFSSDGSYVAVAERKGIRIFDLRILADPPDALAERVARIGAEFEVQSATEVTENGLFRVLSFDEWKVRRDLAAAAR
jgi:hypothetical protein